MRELDALQTVEPVTYRCGMDGSRVIVLPSAPSRRLGGLNDRYQDVLDFAYYSGWRKREILELRWSEVDAAGGVVRLAPERSKTRVGRVLPISAPIAAVLVRRRAQRQGRDALVFRRDAVTVRAWRTAWPEACRRAGVPGRLLHDCRRTAALNLVRAGVPERVAMQLTGHRSRAIFDRYNIVHEDELHHAGARLYAYLASRPAPQAAEVIR